VAGIQIPPAPVNIHVNIDFSLLLPATAATAIIIIKSVEQYNWNLKLEIKYFATKREQKCEEVAQQQHILFDYLFNERRSVWILLCGRMGMGTCMPYMSARVSAQRPIQFEAETESDLQTDSMDGTLRLITA